MLGRLGFTPNQIGRMSYEDVVLSVEGFNDGQIHDFNILRHNMWASLAAMGGKKVPKPSEIISLPMDKNDVSPAIMSEEEFWRMVKKLK